MKKLLKNLLIIIYAIIAIAVTICLLSFNDFRVTEFGTTSLVIIDTKALEPEYKKGDLVIADKTSKIEVGDEIFFYNTFAGDSKISKTQVTAKEKVTEKETTYTLLGDKKLSSQYVIGNVNDSTKYSTIGTVLSILESKWGFLFLVVFPTLVAFLYELWGFFDDLRNSKKESK